MDEGDKKKIVHIHQTEMDNFRKDAMAAILELMVKQDKFTTPEKLLAVYAACLDIAFEIDIFDYREFVERVIEANERTIRDIHEGFAQAVQPNATKPDIPSPMRFWGKAAD